MPYRPHRRSPPRRRRRHHRPKPRAMAATIPARRVVERRQQRVQCAVSSLSGAACRSRSSLAALGRLVAVSKLVTVVAGPVWVALARRWPRKNVLAVCCGFWGVWTAAMGLAQNFVQLLVLATVAAAGIAGGGPLANGLVADLFDDAGRGRAVGVLYGIAALGLGMAGPVLGLLADVQNGWRYGFFASGAVQVVFGVLILAFLHDPGVGATYYGMVSRLDDQLGRVSRAVEQAGAAARTVTLFFADHGEYLGDHGVIEKWPSAMHDCITRDPLIISAPGLGEGGRECDAMVEMVDVLPTVLDLAGVPAPHRHFGRSLLPLLRDPAAPHRELAFTEGGFTVEEEPQMEHAAFPYDLKSALQHEDPTLAGRAVAVRDREWTYVWRLYEQPEPYHRAEGPHECTNLAGRPEYAEVERRLHDAVLRRLVETSGVVPADPDPRRPDVDLPAPAHS
ncbi:MFS transporter [Streptomyces sp. NPDC087845]|uniref:MFS transporter n=2 Tax=unclassified Streptomyces TaxID=2593676 RepID=UPI0038197D27